MYLKKGPETLLFYSKYIISETKDKILVKMLIFKYKLS
ncbi:hypothetical protein CLV24_113113 [Pontibacter ummariensis]|uniref:Uncharacterized protein n=1 Tax=Pontibacter ummariensis TaxID=1610492 RepID=A0A239H9G1_9BACT|nr:hypothetical protein CLV24_113113 [Pontibacter ummariensis]SNS77997.1 hypothetical protein SAMN06296052_11342 [Pontibacter ummariensis]